MRRSPARGAHPRSPRLLPLHSRHPEPHPALRPHLSRAPEKKPTTFTRLDEILHEDFDTLRDAHAAQDAWYVEFCDALDPAELDGTLSFDTVETGEYFSLPLRRCLTNLFQHQIHHRGQTHHMLSHAGIDPPPLDFIKFASGE